jgi:hypothetical protein
MTFSGELLRIYAAGLLEEHGFTALEAADAETALKILESNIPSRTPGI